MVCNMADTPYTPKYRSTTDLMTMGSSILGAVVHFGLDNHPNSQRIIVSRWIADVEWNRAQAYAGKNNSRWMDLLGTVERLELALNRA